MLAHYRIPKKEQAAIQNAFIRSSCMFCIYTHKKKTRLNVGQTQPTFSTCASDIVVILAKTPLAYDKGPHDGLGNVPRPLIWFLWRGLFRNFGERLFGSGVTKKRCPGPGAFFFPSPKNWLSSILGFVLCIMIGLYQEEGVLGVGRRRGIGGGRYSIKGEGRRRSKHFLYDYTFRPLKEVRFI